MTISLMPTRTLVICFLREFRPISHQSQWLCQERKRVRLGYRLYQREPTKKYVLVKTRPGLRIYKCAKDENHVPSKIRINVAVSFFRPVWLVPL